MAGIQSIYVLNKNVNLVLRLLSADANTGRLQSPHWVSMCVHSWMFVALPFTTSRNCDDVICGSHDGDCRQYHPLWRDAVWSGRNLRNLYRNTDKCMADKLAPCSSVNLPENRNGLTLSIWISHIWCVLLCTPHVYLYLFVYVALFNYFVHISDRIPSHYIPSNCEIIF